MKLSKILKYSLIVCLAVFLIMVCSLIYSRGYTSAQTADHELLGYMWSSNYGWVSLNSKNCQQFETAECFYSGFDKFDYNVELNADNTLTGWGWSENVGWVCFGSTCTEATEFGSGTPSGGWWLGMTNTGEIQGWAKILSLGDDGWLRFNSGGVTTKPSQNPIGNDCYNCRDYCVDPCSLGDPDPICQVPVCNENEGDAEECGKICINYEKRCESCFSQTVFGNVSGTYHPVPSVIGEDCDDNPDECWTVEGNGYFCSDCGSCVKDELSNGDFRVTCDNCSGSCKNYGSIANRIYEEGDSRLIGWAWNGDDDINGLNGAGWVKFSAGSVVVNPWLQTKYGTIFTPKIVSQRSAEIGKNATYCIFAEEMFNISSSRCEELVSGIEIDFPAQEEEVIFRNILGKVDIVGLITKVRAERNKYGQIVNDLGDSWSGNVTLDNQVYYADGNLNVADIILENSSNDRRGNGTIIVNGNLIINGNIEYANSANLPEDLTQTASIAWIVKGDVKINNQNVNKIVGAFLVLGDGKTQCQKQGSSIYDRYQENHCGVFSSGEYDSGLSVYGLLIARAFNFDRVFSDPLIGSERIIYDGRLVANPPPGLEGFFEKLPIVRDFSY